MLFLLRKKRNIDISYPGGYCFGLHDTGNFKIGDSLDRRLKYYITRVIQFFSRSKNLKIYPNICRPE